MFQPGFLGRYPPQVQNVPIPPPAMFRPNPVPYYNDFNKNQHPNQFQNQPPLLQCPRYPSPHQPDYQQTPPNAICKDHNRMQPSDWPPLSEGKPRGPAPQNKLIQGCVDDGPDACLSKEQQEEKKQLYKLFSQVLRDNGPMDVCNQRILSTFMSLPESKRKIISKIGGIQRFFLKSPMFLIQGDIVYIAENNSNGISPPKTSDAENVCPRNGPFRCVAELITQDTPNILPIPDTFSPKEAKANDNLQPTAQAQTPTKVGLDVQAQPFSPLTPTSVKNTKSATPQSPNLDSQGPQSTTHSRNQSESETDDILLELQTNLEKIHIDCDKSSPLDKSAEDCHNVFTEKARLLGINVGGQSANTKDTVKPSVEKVSQRQQQRSSESRPFSPTTVQDTKKTDEYKRRKLEASMKQKLELELTQVKLNNMEHTTEQIERRAQMKIKVKDMDLKKVNAELTDALNQIAELTAQNNKLQNINVGLIANVTSLTTDNDNMQEDILKMGLVKKDYKDTDEITMRLKETLTRAREAEIKVLENIHKECLERIDKVVQKKENNFISMFSPEDNISVETLWKEYIALVDIQKADLKEQYDKILESLKKDVPLKDTPPLSEQDICVFVKKGRKQKLEVQSSSLGQPSGLNKRPMLSSSLPEKKKSLSEEQPAVASLRQPRRTPIQMMSMQPTTMQQPPGLTGFTPFSPVQPVLRPRSLATSPPVPQVNSQSSHTQIPVIRSPPLSNMNNNAPVSFSPKLAPSFDFNFNAQTNDKNAAHRRYQQSMPFQQMPAPVIPSLALQLSMPAYLTSVPPAQISFSQNTNPYFTLSNSTSPYQSVNRYSHDGNSLRMNSNLPTSEANTIQSTTTKIELTTPSNFVPNLMDLNLDRGDGPGQIKRKMEPNNPTNVVPNLMDLDLGRSEVPPKRISGEDLDISCMTYHVELDETECWDDEDFPSTHSPDLKPSRGVGYQFGNPAAGDTSVCMSDLVKTLQTWTQEIPGAFNVDKGGDVDCKNKTSPQTEVHPRDKIPVVKLSPTDRRPVAKLSPTDKQGISKRSQVSTTSTSPNFVKPSSFNELEVRRWQEVTKKKKRRVQGVPVAEVNKSLSSLDKIVYTLALRLPHLDRSDYIDSIKAVRDLHKGSLSGVPLTEIVRRCCNYLREGQKKLTPEQQRKNDEEICAVCHEDVNATNEKLNKLECGHRFHDGCIKQWIHTRERTCPLCRKFILLPDDFPAL